MYTVLTILNPFQTNLKYTVKLGRTVSHDDCTGRTFYLISYWHTILNLNAKHYSLL